MGDNELQQTVADVTRTSLRAAVSAAAMHDSRMTFEQYTNAVTAAHDASSEVRAR